MDNNQRKDGKFNGGEYCCGICLINSLRQVVTAAGRWAIRRCLHILISQNNYILSRYYVKPAMCMQLITSSIDKAQVSCKLKRKIQRKAAKSIF